MKTLKQLRERVDCRTREFKSAVKRTEARKAKRETSEMDEIMARTNRAIFGEDSTMSASGSDATGPIDMPDVKLGKVKKRKK